MILGISWMFLCDVLIEPLNNLGDQIAVQVNSDERSLTMSSRSPAGKVQDRERSEPRSAVTRFGADRHSPRASRGTSILSTNDYLLWPESMVARSTELWISSGTSKCMRVESGSKSKKMIHLF